MGEVVQFPTKKETCEFCEEKPVGIFRMEEDQLDHPLCATHFKETLDKLWDFLRKNNKPENPGIN